MGICYSKTGNKREASSGENEHDGKTNLKLNLKKSSSGDFATFLSKLTGGGAAVAAAEERALHQIPGRLFSNGANSIACLYTQQGKKGTNQDAMIVWENFCTRSNTNTIFCGVFDGHGPFGHMVARKVRDSLPFLLREEWEAKSDSEQISATENGNNEGMIRFDKFMDDDGFDSIEIDDNEKLPEVHMPLKKSMLRAFKLMDKQLNLHPTIDCFCSGTTAVTMIMQDQDLIIGNIGDSRGVLATRDEGNSLKAVQLTVDLKPNLPREAARIQKCKGRVFALQDEPEVARVWLPNSDSPGLAMARAFGDFCLKDFGLISVPDIYYHQVTKGDEFVILATDGVWDVLSNKEAVDIVASAPSRATAARALVDCATRAWRLKYPTSKNDDCAVVCLFLQQVPRAIMAKAQNITTLPEAEMNKVPKEEGHRNSSNIDTVASPADNITTNSEVDMTKVPNEGITEGSNIDIVGDKDEESRTAMAVVENNVIRDSDLEMEVPKEGYIDVVASHFDVLVYSDNVIESSEIEPVVEPVDEEKLLGTTLGQSRRSLAECLSSTEDEEWSALEGVTRVNSLLSLPRFLSFEKRSASWRKWL